MIPTPFVMLRPGAPEEEVFPRKVDKSEVYRLFKLYSQIICKGTL